MIRSLILCLTTTALLVGCANDPPKAQESTQSPNVSVTSDLNPTVSPEESEKAASVAKVQPEKDSNLAEPREGTPGFKDVIFLNLENGIIDGINMRQEGELLLKSLGPGRVRKTTELLEGDPSDLYIVSFSGHEVYRHWNAFSTKDPVFRTAGGLGVGSLIQDFQRVYGEGERSCEEGCAIYFRRSLPNQFSIPLGDIGREQSTSVSYKTTVARELWIW